MQVRRLLLLCPLAFALAPPAARASFDLTSQTRDVGVTVTQHTLSCLPPPTGCSVLSTTIFSDSESAPDFSPFSATASVSPFTTIFSTQASTLSATSLVAQGNGTHSGSGTLTTPPNIYTTVESTSATLHRVGFDVDAATPYRLSGSARSTGGLSANATTRITLKTSRRREARGSRGDHRLELSGPVVRGGGPAARRELRRARAGLVRARGRGVAAPRRRSSSRGTFSRSRRAGTTA